MSTLMSIMVIYFIQVYLVNYPFFKTVQQSCSLDWLDDILHRAQIIANDFHKVPVAFACTLFLLALSLGVLLLQTILGYVAGRFGLFLFNCLTLFYCFSVSGHKKYPSVFLEAFEKKFAILFWFVCLGSVGSLWFLVCTLCSLKHSSPKTQAEKILDMDCSSEDHDKIKHFSNKENGSHKIYYAKSISNCLFNLHIMLAWLPARITGLIFILVGNFDRGFSSWKHVVKDWTMPHEKVLDLCGQASLGEKLNVENSLSLVDRTFVGWVIFCIMVTLMI